MPCVFWHFISNNSYDYFMMPSEISEIEMVKVKDKYFSLTEVVFLLHLLHLLTNVSFKIALALF